MTALEVSVKECCVGLLSVRATERKKNGEILKDFLTRNAVPSLLSENTIKGQGYSWNNVFHDIHEFVLKVDFTYIFNTYLQPGPALAHVAYYLPTYYYYLPFCDTVSMSVAF